MEAVKRRVMIATATRMKVNPVRKKNQALLILKRLLKLRKQLRVKSLKGLPVQRHCLKKQRLKNVEISIVVLGMTESIDMNILPGKMREESVGSMKRLIQEVDMIESPLRMTWKEGIVRIGLVTLIKMNIEVLEILRNLRKNAKSKVVLNRGTELKGKKLLTVKARLRS